MVAALYLVRGSPAEQSEEVGGRLPRRPRPGRRRDRARGCSARRCAPRPTPARCPRSTAPGAAARVVGSEETEVDGDVRWYEVEVRGADGSTTSVRRRQRGRPARLRHVLGGLSDDARFRSGSGPDAFPSPRTLPRWRRPPVGTDRPFERILRCRSRLTTPFPEHRPVAPCRRPRHRRLQLPRRSSTRGRCSWRHSRSTRRRRSRRSRRRPQQFATGFPNYVSPPPSPPNRTSLYVGTARRPAHRDLRRHRLPDHLLTSSR